MVFPTIAGGNLASTFFQPQSKGEGILLEFLTLTEAKRFSEASRGCTAIAESFFNKLARGLTSGRSPSQSSLNRELAILEDHLREAKMEVKRAFPSLSSFKQDAVIAKTFFSKLSYPISRLSYERKPEVPLAIAKKEERPTGAIEKFIRESQDLETVEKFIPFLDQVIKELERNSPSLIEKRDLAIENFCQELEEINHNFPGILQIYERYKSGIFERPSEKEVRDHLSRILPADGNAEMNLEIVINLCMSGPKVLTQGLTADNFQIMENTIFYIIGLEQNIIANENWNRIKQLPYRTPEEIQIKARMVRKAMPLLLHQAPLPFSLENGGFTQILPEMETIIKAHIYRDTSVLHLSHNSFRRVPVLPRDTQVLYMEGNPLTSFENLPPLQRLELLDFTNTGLYAVPNALNQIIAPNLRSVRLIQNNLIEIPDPSFIFSSREEIRELRLDKNPIIYIPPRLFFSDNLFVTLSNGRFDFMLDMLDQGKSPLGKLYHYFVRPTKTYNKQECEELFEKVSASDRNLIFERVWVESERPETDDRQWGEHHTFDDLSILARAVRSAILTKLERLPTDEKNTVYGRIYHLSGSPKFVSPRWGEYNAKKQIARLADALSSEISDTTSSIEVERKRIPYFEKLYLTLSEIREFNFIRIDPMENIEDLTSKNKLFKLYKDFLRQKEASRDVLETREIEFPDILASFEALIEERIPDFCRAPEAPSGSGGAI